MQTNPWAAEHTHVVLELLKRQNEPYHGYVCENHEPCDTGHQHDKEKAVPVNPSPETDVGIFSYGHNRSALFWIYPILQMAIPDNSARRRKCQVSLARKTSGVYNAALCICTLSDTRILCGTETG